MTDITDPLDLRSCQGCESLRVQLEEARAALSRVRSALEGSPEAVEQVARLMWNRTMESALWPRWDEGLAEKLRQRPREDARAILAALRTSCGLDAPGDEGRGE
jgi:hypothetical protein